KYAGGSMKRVIVVACSCWNIVACADGDVSAPSGNSRAGSDVASANGSSGGGLGGRSPSTGDSMGLGGASDSSGGGPVGVSGSEAGTPHVIDAGSTTGAFVHPGLLHSSLDFDRIKVKVSANAQPWKAGWDKLVANAHASLSWTANPAAVVYRGADGV